SALASFTLASGLLLAIALSIGLWAMAPPVKIATDFVALVAPYTSSALIISYLKDWNQKGIPAVNGYIENNYPAYTDQAASITEKLTVSDSLLTLEAQTTLSGIIVVTVIVLASILAYIAINKLASLRQSINNHPIRTLFIVMFLTIAAISGLGIYTYYYHFEQTGYIFEFTAELIGYELRSSSLMLALTKATGYYFSYPVIVTAAAVGAALTEALIYTLYRAASAVAGKNRYLDWAVITLSLEAIVYGSLKLVKTFDKQQAIIDFLATQSIILNFNQIITYSLIAVPVIILIAAGLLVSGKALTNHYPVRTGLSALAGLSVAAAQATDYYLNNYAYTEAAVALVNANINLSLPVLAITVTAFAALAAFIATFIALSIFKRYYKFIIFTTAIVAAVITVSYLYDHSLVTTVLTKAGTLAERLSIEAISLSSLATKAKLETAPIVAFLTENTSLKAEAITKVLSFNVSAEVITLGLVLIASLLALRVAYGILRGSIRTVKWFTRKEETEQTEVETAQAGSSSDGERAGLSTGKVIVVGLGALMIAVGLSVAPWMLLVMIFGLLARSVDRTELYAELVKDAEFNQAVERLQEFGYIDNPEQLIDLVVESTLTIGVSGVIIAATLALIGLVLMVYAARGKVSFWKVTLTSGLIGLGSSIVLPIASVFSIFGLIVLYAVATSLITVIIAKSAKTKPAPADNQQVETAQAGSSGNSQEASSSTNTQQREVAFSTTKRSKESTRRRNSKRSIDRKINKLIDEWASYLKESIDKQGKLTSEDLEELRERQEIIAQRIEALQDEQQKRRFQFSLRTLFILTTFISLTLGARLYYKDSPRIIKQRMLDRAQDFREGEQKLVIEYVSSDMSSRTYEILVIDNDLTLNKLGYKDLGSLVSRDVRGVLEFKGNLLTRDIELVRSLGFDRNPEGNLRFSGPWGWTSCPEENRKQQKQNINRKAKQDLKQINGKASSSTTVEQKTTKNTVVSVVKLGLWAVAITGFILALVVAFSILNSTELSGPLASLVSKAGQLEFAKNSLDYLNSLAWFKDGISIFYYSEISFIALSSLLFSLLIAYTIVKTSYRTVKWFTRKEETEQTEVETAQAGSSGNSDQAQTTKTKSTLARFTLVTGLLLAIALSLGLWAMAPPAWLTELVVKVAPYTSSALIISGLKSWNTEGITVVSEYINNTGLTYSDKASELVTQSVIPENLLTEAAQFNLSAGI
ncbi:MAG: hypothetical protein KJ977_05495, partial [Candidatus Omnitrophica bacterium]|nr:hypothetical protein [Candidatus Omnitrophota bacterium]